MPPAPHPATPSIRLGYLGLAVFVGGLLWTAAHFTNTDGTAFNPLRNFVSELGSERASPMAAVFSASILTSSLLFFPLVCVLAAQLSPRLRRYAIATAIISLIGCVTVSFASMEHLKPHLAGSLLFFGGWLATSFLFTVGLWHRHGFRHAPALIFTGLLAALSAAIFLTVLIIALIGFLNGAFQIPKNFQRPAVWDIAVLEWTVVFCFLLWTAAAILHLRRPAPSTP